MFGVLLPDKVFGPTSLTEVVYEEGAKDVALSALTGINGNIFNVCFLVFMENFHIVWMLIHLTTLGK